MSSATAACMVLVVVGLVMFVRAKADGEVKRIGEILFAVGLLALLCFHFPRWP